MQLSGLTYPQRCLLELLGSFDRVVTTQLHIALDVTRDDPAQVARVEELLGTFRQHGVVTMVGPSAYQARLYPDPHAAKLTPSGRVLWAELMTERGQPVQLLAALQGVHA